MKHKIGIDARELEKPAYGVARYLRNVISSIISQMQNVEIYLYFKNRISADDLLEDKMIQPVLIKLSDLFNKDILWQQIYLPRYLKKDRIDLFFFGQYTIPYNISIHTVCTVHDLSFFVDRRWFPPREGFLLRNISRACLRKASKVIASSYVTAGDIKKYIPMDHKNITTIYPGLSERFLAEPRRDNSLLHKYQIKDKYILWVGSILNRRKITLLLVAYEDIAKIDKHINLVIIGVDRRTTHHKLSKMIEEHKNRDRIHYFEYVDEEELISFYDNAEVFVFISVYEGFGYTPLEAASRGLPLLLYDNPTFREIFGDHAHYIEDREALVKTLSSILEKDRNSLKTKAEIYMKTIREKYSAEANNVKLIEIMEGLLAG